MGYFDDGIHNAKIISTHLGPEYHGIFSSTLYLDYGGTQQGFGGYALDSKPDTHGGDRVPHIALAVWVYRILEVLKIDGWEKLPGTPCRAKLEHGRVVAIGNYLEDLWFNPAEEFKAFKDKEQVNE